MFSIVIFLNSLEIPYSIAVIADGEYKVILKQFEDQQSPLIFEKVFECLMIRRFRDNLVNSQKFAKESYMFSKEFSEKKSSKFFENHGKKLL